MQPQSRSNEKILDKIPSYQNLLTSPDTRVFILSDVRLCRDGLALLLAQQAALRSSAQRLPLKPLEKS
jgi:hypothetical protein